MRQPLGGPQELVRLGRLLPHITIEPTEERDEAYDVPPAALPQTA